MPPPMKCSGPEINGPVHGPLQASSQIGALRCQPLWCGAGVVAQLRVVSEGLLLAYFRPKRAERTALAPTVSKWSGVKSSSTHVRWSAYSG